MQHCAGSSKRSKVVICRCKSHCTVYNTSTGLYEGVGHRVSRQTRDNHKEDDNRLLWTRNGRQRSQVSLTSSSASGLLPTQNQVAADLNVNWIKAVEQEVTWRSELPVSNPDTPFKFVNDPMQHGDYVPPTEAQLSRPNWGTHALLNMPVKIPYLDNENRLCELLTVLARMELKSDGHALMDRIREELQQMDRQKELQWAQQRYTHSLNAVLVNTGIFQYIYITSSVLMPPAFSAEIHFHKRGPQNPIVKAVSLVSLVMQYIYRTPRRALRPLLAGIQDTLKLAGTSPDIVQQIPKDPRSASSGFRLDGVTRSFISCPSCHSLYPYNPGDNPSNPVHPSISHCTFTKTPSSAACGAALWMNHRLGPESTILKPCRRYLHQDLKSWVGRLLSRKGIEDTFESAPRGPVTDPDAPVNDIWLSRVFQNLKDPAGQPFLPGTPGEGRLVFSFATDAFHPLGSKTAKQTISSTGIWLVCLNFPDHLRYLQENIFFAGVIEGPEKPSNEKINPYVQLVVNDMLEFWNPGVFFSRTFKYKFGRLYKAMLVPVIADMLALRQVIGLPGSTTAHYFCTFCDLDFDDIEVFDRAEWPAKNSDHIRFFAKLWKEASCERHQQAIFEATGLRWSALFDLPYWDPTLYAIIDSMHALDLNLIQNHLRLNFQINPDTKGGDGTVSGPHVLKNPLVSSKNDIKALNKCQKLVQENHPKLLYELLDFKRKVLYTFCVQHDVKSPGHTKVVGTRWVLAKNIYHWVMSS